MKTKILLRARWLLCAMLAVFLTSNVWAAESVYKQTIFSADNQTGNSSYTATFTNTTNGFSVTVGNANNNNNGWSGHIKMGRKNNASVGYITTDDVIDKPITKVTLTIEAVTATSINSIKLYKSTDASVWTEVASFTVATGGQDAAIATADQADDLYYKIEVDCKSASKNGIIELSQVDFYAEDSDDPNPTPTLESISVSGDMENKVYETTDHISLAGMNVEGTYSDENTETITDGITWEVRTDGVSESFSPATYALTAGQTSLQIRATVSGISSDWIIITGLTVTEHVATPGTYEVVPNNVFWGKPSQSGSQTVSANALDISVVSDDVTYNLKNNSSTNSYMNSTSSRAYNNYTLTISVPSGYELTAITFTGGTWVAPTASAGTMNSKSWTGHANSVTFTFSGTSYMTNISVTYAAIVPTVTATPNALSFAARQNVAVDGQTFTLTASNLESGLTLAASAGYTVAPTTLTAEAAMADGGVEVTVTPATPTTTTTPVEGTVTISGGGLAENVVVDLSMAVTPTFAVNVVVNNATMGTATINGGAAVYATGDDELALVATANSGYEFLNWTVSNEDILLDDENNATTTAIAGAAGTITANFQAQACSGLAAPTLDEVTTTYYGATITWNTVANADGYVLNITKHADASAVVTDELIVAPEVSFEKTGLDANTQYDYTVMATGDGTAYCDENNPLLAGSFTTADYPAAVVTLSENGEETILAGSHYLSEVITLPTTVSSLCTGKVLAGWSSVEIAEAVDEEPATNYWAAGAEYTISSVSPTLYAVYATSTGSGSGNVEFNAGDYADANGWENGVAQTEFTIDGITFTVGGGGNNGKYYTSDKTWRFYNGGSLTISGAGITGVTSVPSCDFTESDGAYTYNFTATVKIKTITVSASAASYSAYTTVCTPALAAPTFSVEAGTYTEVQSIAISATAGATIYYTTDGTTPTDESDVYSSAIALTDCGTTTIKAFAKKAGMTDSEVAEATYTITLSTANTQATAYTPAEAIAIYDGDCDKSAEVYVIGVVTSATISGTQYNVYVKGIGTDGSVTFEYYKMYKDGEHTAFADGDITVGDTITAKGTLSKYSSTYEFAAGCVMVEHKPYTAAKTPIANTQATAYTCAQAINFIDNAVTYDLSDEVYVSGVVTSINSSNTIVLHDAGVENSLQLYKADLNGFEVEANDTIIAKGTILKYNSTYEMAEGGQVVEVKEYVAPLVAVTGVTVNATAIVYVGLTATLTAEVAPAEATNKNVYWESDDTSVATVDENGVVTGVAIGTAHITVTTEDGSFTATCEVTVETISPWAGIYTSNVVFEGAGDSYDNSAQVHIGEEDFDAEKVGASKKTGSVVVTVPAGTHTLHFHAASWNSGDITIAASGVENMSQSSFDLTSDAGVSGSSHTFTLANDPMTQYFTFTFDPVETETTITFSKTSGTPNQFIMYGINQEGGPELKSLTIGGSADKTDYEIGQSFSTAGLTVNAVYTIGGVDQAPVDVTGEVTWSIDPVSFTLTSQTSVSVTAAFETKTATTTIPVTVSEPAAPNVTYTTIVAKNSDGKYYAMGQLKGSSNGSLQAVLLDDVFDGKLVNVAEEDRAAITWIMEVTADGTTFKAQNGKYLTGGTSTDLTLKDTPFYWEWNDNYGCYANNNRGFFMAGSDYFKNYALNHNGISSTAAEYLSEYIDVEDTQEIVTLREGLVISNIGTICWAADIYEVEGGTFYEPEVMKEDGVSFVEAVREGGVYPKGKPYLFQAEGTEMRALVGKTTTDVAGYNKGMFGTFVDLKANPSTDTLIVYQNKLRMTNNNWVRANRAYLLKSELPTEATPAPGRRHLVVGRYEEPTGIENVELNASERTQKVVLDGQLYIVRDGKWFDVTGQQVR